MREVGLLPLFRSEVPGFSVQDITPEEAWFQEPEHDPWRWRAQIAEKGEFIYAKMISGKAAFATPEWYAHLANHRRGGMGFDERYESGVVSYKQKRIVEALRKSGALLSSELRRQCGFGKGGEKGFSSAIIALQMSCDLVVDGFGFKLDRWGRPYGWSVTRYALAEARFGEDCADPGVPPAESARRLREQFFRILPDAMPAQIDRLLK